MRSINKISYRDIIVYLSNDILFNGKRYRCDVNTIYCPSISYGCDKFYKIYDELEFIGEFVIHRYKNLDQFKKLAYDLFANFIILSSQ